MHRLFTKVEEPDNSPSLFSPCPSGLQSNLPEKLCQTSRLKNILPTSLLAQDSKILGREKNVPSTVAYTFCHILFSLRFDLEESYHREECSLCWPPLTFTQPPQQKYCLNDFPQFSPSLAPKSPPEKTRYDTSLGLLTKKFVDLLAQSSDGVLDLNLAAETLQVNSHFSWSVRKMEAIQTDINPLQRVSQKYEN